MRPAIYLEVQPRLGSDIKVVCMEVHQLACALRIEVRCKCNDVLLYAFPRGSYETLVANYERAAASGAPFKAAHSINS